MSDEAEVIDIDPKEVEPEQNGQLAINPAAVLQILQVKAQTNELLASQIEAAVYRAALEEARQ